MLRQLSIRNLAVIDELTLDFDAGFSVLTGETGAGKSILVDALGLLLGDRADASLVRTGAQQAEISAELDVAPTSPARAWLREQLMENPDEPQSCLIRRAILAEGRTRASVNGIPATATQLRELGEQLVEIHGQSEHHSLLRADAQRAVVDEFGKHEHLLAAVAAAVETWRAAEHEIERIRGLTGRDKVERDLMRHELRDLQALHLQDGELERLHDDQKRLANMGKLLGDGSHAESMLYGGENSLHDQLAKIRARITALVHLHEGFSDAASALDQAQTCTQEAARAIRAQLDRLDLDPQRLAEVERRMSAVHELARRHRIRAEQLPARMNELQQALDASEHAAEQLAAADAQRAQAMATYRDAAAKLSAARGKTATEFAKKVRAVVRELGMPKAEFTVAVTTAPRELPSVQGDDQVRFDFSANPGQSARALSKTASGGELSRLSLAIQLVANRRGAAATLIFDEVDAGIGGAVAEIVGQKLRELAAGRQVLSVTHLPQVAAQGQQHYAVAKEVRDRKTFTIVRRLLADQRVEELARMQAGVQVTEAALTHARELLARASQA